MLGARCAQHPGTPVHRQLPGDSHLSLKRCQGPLRHLEAVPCLEVYYRKAAYWRPFSETAVATSSMPLCFNSRMHLLQEFVLGL
jgi:hypothetical protein